MVRSDGQKISLQVRANDRMACDILRPPRPAPTIETLLTLLPITSVVAKGQISNITNSHTDMAPTILKMLGVPLQDDFDGAPVAYTEEELSGSTKSELVNVEFWNAGQTPIGFKKGEYFGNTYKALRLMASNESFFYSTWCNGEREFYDMKNDTQQMKNRLAADPVGQEIQYYGRPEKELFNRLDALLMVTKSCKMVSNRRWTRPLIRSSRSSLRSASRLASMVMSSRRRDRRRL
jgi:hypothetical protein